MPIPFLEALRGRLAPVFNGTVPLERKKEIITNRAWLACQGLDSTDGTNTRALHKHLEIFCTDKAFPANNTVRGFKVEVYILNIWHGTWCVMRYTKGKEEKGELETADDHKRPQNIRVLLWWILKNRNVWCWDVCYRIIKQTSPLSLLNCPKTWG